MRYKLPDGNVILADQAFIDANYPDAVLLPEEATPTATIRRLSKLGFVGRLGADFAAILTAAKTSVEIEMFVRTLDWATPEADGTSVDLDDPRVVYALDTLEANGVIAQGRSAEIRA